MTILESINYPILNKMINTLGFDNNIARFGLVQCNFSEYIERHSEEQNYFFDLYNFQFQGFSGHFSFAFNSHFIKSRAEVKDIIDSIKNNWKESIGAEIDFAREGSSIYELNFEKFGMLQSVHYLYPLKELIANNIDYQIFKIIYPYNTLKPVLKKWDLEIKV